jgi:thymidylate kinase
MIIECFGPPGAGKTTFALALTARLRSAGLKVFTLLSAQPSEPTFLAADNSDAKPGSLPPTTEFMNIARSTARSRSVEAEPQFLQTIRAFRMRRYLKGLSQAWTKAEKSNDIWIFDQAYVQFILSILRVQPRISDEDIIALLGAVPRSDLVISIETPAAKLEERLRQRHRWSVTGMFFRERSMNIFVQVEIAKRFAGLLNRSDRCVISVRSESPEQIANDIRVFDKIIEKITIREDGEK